MNGLAQREVVETFPAFANRISDDQYAGTLTYKPFAYFNFNAAASRLSFSDSNIRKGYYISASYILMPDMGLSVSSIFRGFSDKFRSALYFSPINYQSNLWMARIARKWGATMHYYIDGGYGHQYITPSEQGPTYSSPIYQWGFGLSGPIAPNLILNLYFADVHQISSFIAGPNYRYEYGSVGVTVLL